MSPYIDITLTAGLDGLILCLQVLAVMIPVFIIYEAAKAYGLFDRPWPGISEIMSHLGMGYKAVLPLMVGLFLGLVYGAGILVAMGRKKDLDHGERLALAVFLVTCHSVVEDTIIFTLVGGSALGILAPRLVLALGLTAFLAHFSRIRKNRTASGLD